MIKSLLLASTLTVTSTGVIVEPAKANDFGGIYVEATGGYDDVLGQKDTTNVTYGAAAGINVPVTDHVIVGAEATLDNVFDRRDVGASARIGYTLGKFMPYAKIGYSNYRDVRSRNLDGFRVGGGVEYNIGHSSYVKVEYRYTDFEKNIGKHGVLGGVGIRF
jgi:outer membrane immunogenic protein